MVKPTRPEGQAAWLWQTKRLFPHPMFSGCISTVCLLVAAVMTLGAIADQQWPFAAAGLVFAIACYATSAATWSLIKDRRVPRQTPIATEPEVPTFAIMTLLICIFTWQGSIALLIMDLYFKKGPDTFKYVLTVGIAIASTLFIQVRGKRILRQYFSKRKTRPIVLSARQSLYVVIFTVGLSCYFVWVLA